MRLKNSLQWALLVTLAVIGGIGFAILFLGTEIALCDNGHYIWAGIELIAVIFLIALMAVRL